MAAYTRVSTQDQSGAGQREEIEKWMKNNGIKSSGIAAALRISDHRIQCLSDLIFLFNLEILSASLISLVVARTMRGPRPTYLRSQF